MQNTATNTEVTIVVYIHESLTGENERRIERLLLDIDGITGVEFDSFRPRLIFIRHVPAQIGSAGILDILDKNRLYPHLIVGI